MEINKNLQILKHPYYGNSKKIIDSFSIIGYKSTKIKNKILPFITKTNYEQKPEYLVFKEGKNKPSSIDVNEVEKIDEFLYKYQKLPKIINHLSCHNDKKIIEEDDVIISKIYPEIPYIIKAPLNNSTSELIKPISFIFYNKKLENLEEKEKIKSENPDLIYYDVSYIGYVHKFYESIKKDNQLYYFPKAFCIISQYPLFNLFNYLMDYIYNLFTKTTDLTEIPIEILLYNILNFVPSPYFSNIYLELFPSTLLVQYSNDSTSTTTKSLSPDNKKVSTSSGQDLPKVDPGSPKLDPKRKRTEASVNTNEEEEDENWKIISVGANISKKDKKEKEKLEKENIDFINKSVSKVDNINRRSVGQLSGYQTFDIDLHYLFELFDTSAIIKIFIYNLLEMPIVFFSTDLKKLTITLYVLASLSYPFNDYDKINIFTPVELKIFLDNPMGNNLPIGSTLHGINEKYHSNKQYNFFGDFYFSVDLDDYVTDIKIEVIKSKKNEIKKSTFSDLPELIKFDKFIIDIINYRKSNIRSFIKDLVFILDNQIKKFIETFDLNLEELTFFVNDNRILKTNKKLQYFFYRSVLSLLKYIYMDFSFNLEVNKDKDKDKDNKEKENKLKFDFKIKFNESEFEKKVAVDDKFFFKTFLRTSKFNSFFIKFIINKSNEEKEEIPFTFTEEFLHQSRLNDIPKEIEVRKENLENDLDKTYKDIYYFRFIDHLFNVVDDKRFFHFNFRNFYIYYYKNLRIFFSEISKSSENIHLNLEVKNAIRYRYQFIELNDEIIYNYMYIVSNIANQTSIFPELKLRKAQMNVIVPRRKIVNSVEKNFSKNKELTSKKYYILTMLLIICVTTKNVSWEEQYKFINTIDLKDNLFLRKYLTLIAVVLWKIIIESNNEDNEENVKQRWKDFISILLYLEVQNTVPNYEIMILYNYLKSVLKNKNFNIDLNEIKNLLMKKRKKKNVSSNNITNTANTVENNENIKLSNTMIVPVPANTNNIGDQERMKQIKAPTPQNINLASTQIRLSPRIKRKSSVDQKDQKDINNQQLESKRQLPPQKLNYIKKTSEFVIKLENNYCKDKILGQRDILEFITIHKTSFIHKCLLCRFILAPVLVYKNKLFKRKTSISILSPGKIYFESQALIGQYMSDDVRKGKELSDFKENLQKLFEKIITNLIFHLQIQKESEENSDNFFFTADENTIASIEYIERCFKFNFL